ncbi:hypothetical protein K3165_01500 [Qipengyuania sp. 1XM1-15A]|uniref:hypothetical protein n=1 Tax=Qipengyuania xiamenensis TaxID=2867237 RepID=UPI001C88A90C|nr:hypothetical protein [Qipengyuania xiamenensis]MBX7531594.1 hypothetical protein [Qipengyuania xiamenensis]
MSEQKPSIPKRFQIARRWQWPAAVASALFFLSCLIGWPLDAFWPSAVGLAFFVPAVLLFNIKCYACGFPAFADHQANERLRNDDRFWTRFWGKEYSGVHLPLRTSCSKCGVSFVGDDNKTREFNSVR